MKMPCAVRYPSGIENAEIVDRFYSNGNFSDISFKTDFTDEEKDSLDALIITYGRIVSEAVKAVEEMKNLHRTWLKI